MGGSGKRTSRKADTAPRPDPTSSASTVAARAAAAWSSTASSSSPSRTGRCATATWSPTPSPVGRTLRHPGRAADRPAWSGGGHGGRGDAPPYPTPTKWRPQNDVNSYRLRWPHLADQLPRWRLCRPVADPLAARRDQPFRRDDGRRAMARAGPRGRCAVRVPARHAGHPRRRRAQAPELAGHAGDHIHGQLAVGFIITGITAYIPFGISCATSKPALSRRSRSTASSPGPRASCASRRSSKTERQFARTLTANRRRRSVTPGAVGMNICWARRERVSVPPLPHTPVRPTHPHFAAALSRPRSTLGEAAVVRVRSSSRARLSTLDE